MFFTIRQFFLHWLEKRRAAEMKHIQEKLEQQQWQNSLQQRTHEADLAAGYNQSHFNTMQ